MKSKMKSGMYGSRALIGEANAVVPVRVVPGEENMYTDDRLREQEVEEDLDEVSVAREKLRFDRIDQSTGEYLFLTERTQRPLRFNE